MAQNIRQRIVINSIDNSKAGFESAQRNSNNLNNALNRVRNTLLGLVAGQIFGNFVPDLVRFSDKTIELAGRLKIVTTDTNDYNEAQAELIKLSLATNSNLHSNEELYARMAVPLRVMGYESKQVADVTETLAIGLRLGGASATEAASVMLQLSQAFGSGVLRGEEYNAVAEASIPITQAIADAMGVQIGALRGLAKQGKLTTGVVVDGLLKALPKFRDQLKQIPITIGRAFENIKTKFAALILEHKGFFLAISSGIGAIDANFDSFIEGLKILGTLLGIKLVAATALYILKLKEQLRVSIETARQKKIAAQEEATAGQARRVQAAVDARNATRRQINAERQKLIVADLARSEQNASLQMRANALKEIEAELALQKAKSESLRLSIRSQTITRARTALIARLSSSIDRERLATEQLRAAKQNLAVQEVRTTAAIDAETAAHLRLQSTMAQSSSAAGTFSRRSSAASRRLGWLSVMGGRVAGSFRGIIGVGKLLFQFFGGWIGVAITGFGYVVSKVENWSLALLAVEMAMKKIGAYIRLGIPALFGSDALDYELKIIDETADKAADAIIRAQSGIDAKNRENALNKIKRDKFIADKRKNFSDMKKKRISEIEAMTRKSYKTELKGINSLTTSRVRNIKAEQKAVEALVRNSKDQLGARISNKKDFNRIMLNHDWSANQATINSSKEAVEELLEIQRGFYFDKTAWLDKDSRLYLEANQSQKESAKGLYDYLIKEISRVNEKNRDMYAKSLSDLEGFRQHLHDLEATTEEFIFSIEKRNMTKEQLVIRSRKKIADVQANIDNLSTQNTIENASKISDARDKSLSQLRKIINSEKSRLSNLTKDSKHRKESQETLSKAFTLYKKIAKDAIASDKESIKLAEKRSQSLAENIRERNQELTKYQRKIKELDTLIDEDRVAIVDIDATAATDSLDKLKKNLDKVTNQLVSLDTIDAKDSIDDLVDKFGTAKEKLEKAIRITTEHHDKTVTDAEGVASVKKQTGGVIERQSGGSVDTEPMKFNNGGYSPMSGKVSGINTGDRQKALLEAGEYIVRKSVVDKLGVKYFNLVNYGIDPDKIPRDLEREANYPDPTDSVIRRQSGGLAVVDYDNDDRAKIEWVDDNGSPAGDGNLTDTHVEYLYEPTKETKKVTEQASKKTPPKKTTPKKAEPSRIKSGKFVETRTVGSWTSKINAKVDKELAKFDDDGVDIVGQRSARSIGSEIKDIAYSADTGRASLHRFNGMMSQINALFDRLPALLIESKARVEEQKKREDDRAKLEEQKEKDRIKAGKDAEAIAKKKEKDRIKSDKKLAAIEKQKEKDRVNAADKKAKQDEKDRDKAQEIADEEARLKADALAEQRAKTESEYVVIDNRNYKDYGDTLLDVQTGKFIDKPKEEEEEDDTEETETKTRTN